MRPKEVVTSRRLEPIKMNVYQPLSEVVCNALREAIRDGVFKSHERLMEIRLAEELGVSRTPIREAIRRLEQEGFVVMIPRRGAYVANISEKAVKQVFEIRIALEELAAGLAAENIYPDELATLERMLEEIRGYVENNDNKKLIEADVEFHDILYRASRNDRLGEILNNLREQMLRFRSFSAYLPGRLSETWKEHRELLDAISARDVVGAKAIAVKHLKNAQEVLLEGLRREENKTNTNTKKFR